MTGSRRRSGSSYLEVQVAFAVLGVALAGLAPVVVSQLNLTRMIEELLPGARAPGPGVTPGGTHYLTPVAGAWARKLGIDAALAASPTLVAPDPPPGTANVVTVTATDLLDDPSDPDVEPWVEVLVEEIPPPDETP